MTNKIIIDGINVSEYCSRLQAQYEKTVEQNKQLQQRLREMTAECRELKAKLFQFNHTDAELEQKWNDLMNKAIKNYRRKQALDEIEAHTKENCGFCEVQNSKWCNKEHCNDFLILDIISKAKGAENDRINNGRKML